MLSTKKTSSSRALFSSSNFIKFPFCWLLEADELSAMGDNFDWFCDWFCNFNSSTANSPDWNKASRRCPNHSGSSCKSAMDFININEMCRPSATPFFVWTICHCVDLELNKLFILERRMLLEIATIKLRAREMFTPPWKLHRWKTPFTASSISFRLCAISAEFSFSSFFERLLKIFNTF